MDNPTPDTRWYLRALGQTRGPYTLDQLRRFVAQEMATVDSPVCVAGGTEWQRLGNALPELFRAPLHSPMFPAPSGAPSFPPPPMPPATPTSLAVEAGEADAWMQGWAKICGILLIGGFCWPLYIGFGGSGMLVWPWTLMKEADAGQVFGMLLPLFLGIAALAIGNFLSGRPRAVALFAASVGTLLLSIPLSGDQSGFGNLSGPVRGGGGGVVLLLLLLLSICAIAVGNRLRKSHASASLPRLMAGLGGCGLLASLLIPVMNGQPIIALLFEGMAWRFAWSFVFIILLCLAYGVSALFSFQQASDPAPLCGTLSLQARVLMVAPPFLLLIQFVGMAGGGFGMAFMALVKICALLYGQPLLIAASLAAWLDDVLREQEQNRRLSGK